MDYKATSPKNIKELVFMNSIIALYNPHSANNTGKEKADTLRSHYEAEPTFIDITTITDYTSFFKGLDATDSVVICGGDGTLNRFINEIYDLGIENDIYYYATGNGNDFLRDFDKAAGDAPIKINDEIKNLPTVTVNGKTYRFINGVGFGVDGYCCEVGDRLRLEGAKKINYTSIAIKGLLFHYKPTKAKVTVDGEERTYKKTWIAPTMVGGYYGGGMRPAPAQDRNKRDTVSVTVMHFLKSLLEVVALVLGNALFDCLGSSLNKVLSVLKTKTGDLTNSLDYSELVCAEGSKNYVELSLLLSSGSSSNCACNSNGSSSGYAELLFNSLNEIVKLKKGKTLNLFYQCDNLFASHFHIPPEMDNFNRFFA